MRHFIFEDKDYEINPKWKAPKRNMTMTLMGLGALQYIRKQMRSNSSKNYHSTKPPFDRRQNCTVKTHYSYSLAAHKDQIYRYLQREGAGKNGEKPELYGNSIDDYKNKMVAKNFRIFISPGNQNVDLNTLTKTIVKKIELHTGYKLTWVAANHYNTSHQHAHLLINGIDQNGKDVIFSKDMIKTLMREAARDTCTSLVGSRTNEEIKQEKERQLSANRYTRLDKTLTEFMDDKNILYPNTIKKNREIYFKRLEHLSKLGLCTYKNDCYYFDEDWDKTLKTMARYNMFQDAKRKLQYTEKRSYKLYESSTGIKAGKITGIYKTDDVSDNHAIVLEATDGNAYFIPLYFKPKCQNGAIIKVTPKMNQKGRLTPFIDNITESKLRESITNEKVKGYGEYLNRKSHENDFTNEL